MLVEGRNRLLLYALLFGGFLYMSPVITVAYTAAYVVYFVAKDVVWPAITGSPKEQQ